MYIKGYAENTLTFFQQKEKIATRKVSFLRTTEVIFCSEDSQTTFFGAKKLQDINTRKYFFNVSWPSMSNAAMLYVVLIT